MLGADKKRGHCRVQWRARVNMVMNRRGLEDVILTMHKDRAAAFSPVSIKQQALGSQTCSVPGDVLSHYFPFCLLADLPTVSFQENV